MLGLVNNESSIMFTDSGEGTVTSLPNDYYQVDRLLDTALVDI